MPEPITVADAKAQLNIAASDTTWDTLLTAYISAAREYVENRSGVILMQRDFTEHRASFGRYIELTRRPIAEVTEVGYFDADGDGQTYADFVASVDRVPARIYPALDGWFPSTQTNSLISVTYTAGYEAGSEPPGLLQAIRMLVAHWFAFRETVQDGSLAEVPHGVNALCDQVRGVQL